jgi:hypothetical protein
MDLYHSDIRLPEGFRLPVQTVALDWTRHARQAAINDRYGTIPFWDTLDLGETEVIEVGLTGRKVEKVVLRTRLDNHYDVIYVLIPNGSRPWTVKTVWLNSRRDLHRTLDRSRYIA